MILKDIGVECNRKLALIVLASLILTMIFVPPGVQAEPQASWSSSSTVIATGRIGWEIDPQVAMDNNGNAMAVWSNYDGTTHTCFASRYSGGIWGPPTLIGNGHDASAPLVAMDKNGDAVAVWNQYDGTNPNIYANRYVAGAWGTATLIGTGTGTVACAQQIAMDDYGNVMVVWITGDVSFMHIYANQYWAGSWGTATQIETGPGKSYGAEVAMDNYGNALAVWDQLDGSYNNISVSRYHAGSWGTPTVISQGSSHYNPQVAMGDNGDAVVVWDQQDGPILNIYANRFVGVSWSIPTVIGNSAGYPIYPQVAIDDHGIAVAVWDRPNGTNYGIYTNRFAAGSWGAQTIIGNGSGAVIIPQLAVDNNGHAVVVWQQDSIPEHNYMMVYENITANRYSAGSWGTQTILGSGPGTPGSPDVAMDDNGNALAVWYQTTGAQWTINSSISGEVNVAITSPINGSTIHWPYVQVTGTATVGTSVVINGLATSVASNGSYSAVVPLLKGANIITATATNEIWHIASSANITVTCVDGDQGATALLQARLNATNLSALLANENMTRLEANYNSLSASLNHTMSDLESLDTNYSSLSASLNHTMTDLEMTRTNLTAAHTDLKATQDAQSNNGTTYLLLGSMGTILALVAIVLVLTRRRGPKPS